MFAQILMTLYEFLALHTWLFNAELEFHAAASPRFVALDNLGVGLLDIYFGNQISLFRILGLDCRFAIAAFGFLDWACRR